MSGTPRYTQYIFNQMTFKIKNKFEVLIIIKGIEIIQFHTTQF